MKPALLIALPSGLVVSGVARWAVRLVNALAARGREVALILHAPAPGLAMAPAPIHPGVRVTDLTHLPPLQPLSDPAIFLPAYERALRDLRSDAVILSPNLLVECYALATRVARTDPQRCRVVGWLHIDLPYEYHVQRSFAPVISRFVCVSARIESRLRQVLPHRRDDIARIGYGVPAPPAYPPRPPPDARALRIVYAGRLDAWQKRVLALPPMCEALDRRAIPHELVIVGDGSAASSLRRRARALRQIVILGPRSDEQVAALLRSADILVLPSRFEGLPVSVLEALACGCVPIIARGADPDAEAVRHGLSGIVVDIDDLADDDHAGEMMAEGVSQARARLAQLSLSAYEQGTRWSLHRHADAVEILLDACGDTNAPGLSGVGGTGLNMGGTGVSPVPLPAVGTTIPPDAAERMQRLLRSLAGRRVLIHGAGRHTRELLSAIRAQRTAAIVGIADDDPATWGTMVGEFRVINPAEAAATGATDVVISSWLNEDAIWSRRAAYERRGLRVHRLYHDPALTPRAAHPAAQHAMPTASAADAAGTVA